MGLFLFELGWKPVPLAAVPDGKRVEELYRWLNSERPGHIVELPLGDDDDLQYVYFSTVHWLPLANGVSSFFPATYDQIRSVLRELPIRKAVEHAGTLRIRAVVVHSEKLSVVDLSRWTDEATAHSGLKRIATFGPHVVYSVPHVAVGVGARTVHVVPARQRERQPPHHRRRQGRHGGGPLKRARDAVFSLRSGVVTPRRLRR